MDVFAQEGARVRFEWGAAGAAALRPSPADVCVVVDVLSFTTAVTVAAERGIEVLPFPVRDAAAAAFARDRGALLAEGRALDRPSLSPTSLRRADVRRLVLPSPNGATVALGLARSGAGVLAASLRNASAVGAAVAHRLAADPASSAVVIAAGELRADGGLRFAAEDLWGAGAVIAAIEPVHVRSAEAAVAAAAVAAGVDLRGCASGRELAAAGFRVDVDLAAEVDASRVVPVLRGDRFTA